MIAAESTAEAPATGSSFRARRWLPWLMVAAAAVAIGLLAAPDNSGGPPLDPSSTGPSGTRALVETLEELGNDVSVQSVPPTRDQSTALLLVDRMDDTDRSRVETWVRAGGTLVVTDTSSPLSPARAKRGSDFTLVEPDLRRRCSVAAVRDVDEVSVPVPAMTEVPEGATGCFFDGDDAWMLILATGRGNVVSFGGAGAFTNDRLGDADNAVLIAALLAPRSTDRVAVLRPPLPGTGEKRLIDLVAPNVKVALVQLGVAFLLVALWRARRLGRPVPEPQPVSVAGSELVVAVGHLLQRSRARSQAATVLREGARTAIAHRLGLPARTDPHHLAEVTAERTGLPLEHVLQVLAGEAPVDEDSLVELAQSLESVRREVE